MLCPLEVPDDEGGRVRCATKTLLRFSRADEISRAAVEENRLPNVHQKNWSPVVVGDELYLVFSIEPLTVLHVDANTGECRQVSESMTRAFQTFRTAGSSR